MHISWTQLKKILHVYFKKVHDMNWGGPTWFGVNDLYIKNSWSQTATSFVKFLAFTLREYFCEWNFTKLSNWESDLNFKEKQVWDEGDFIMILMW